MEVVFIGRAGCGKCMSAKHKLQLLNVPFTEKDTVPEEIRDQVEGNYPVILIDGKPFHYAGAIKELKGRLGLI